MSLPTAIIDQIKTIPYNPGILSTNPELAYTLSFNQHPISNHSVHFHPKDSYQSPLVQYQFADFDQSTYDYLLQETTKNYRTKNALVIKGIRASFKEFYARLSALTYQSALKYNSANAPRSENIFEISNLELEYRIEGIKGNIPSKWPQGLNEFQKQITAIPWNAFSTQSYLLLEDVTNQIKTALSIQTKKLKSIQEQDRVIFIDRLIQQFEVLVTISLKTLNQSFVLQQILFIQKLLESQFRPQQQKLICEKLSQSLMSYLSTIPKQNQQTIKYHCNQNLWDYNSFILMKKIHFQKVAGLTHYSVTTDGQYLYVYVSAINGGMYKFGTGNRGTIAGKLYYERKMNQTIGTKIQQVNWVFVKGKLYLKNSTKDPSNLDVYSTQNFRRITTVQLACKSIFGHSVLLTMNKNSILLTDGQKLYFLGKRIKITQAKVKTEQKKQQLQQNEKSAKKPKKKKKNYDNSQQNPQQQGSQLEADQSAKYLEIVLVQFDVDGTIDEEQSDQIDQQEITQIFLSFSGYFTRQECKRAYRLNHYDIMETCQWLFDEGNKQKENNLKILPAQKTVILCESQIVNAFNQKTFKNNSEIVTKEGSILHIFNVNESIWTIDTEEITCYSENGIKIFNAKPNKKGQKNKEQKIQNCNFLTNKSGRFPRNPEYVIIHDPYNRLFYTFAWPSDGHYFPCAILVSKDVKQQASLQAKRRSSVDNSIPQKASQISRFYLTQLSLLQLNDAKNSQFNDHVWWYGQKIIKLNNQNNSANADEKKKISNKKAKIMAKLNKINELKKSYQLNFQQFNRKGKVVKQIIKLNPFSSDGSVENLNIILEAFKNIQNCSKNSLIGSYLIVIEKWLKNSSNLDSKQIEQRIKQVNEILMKIRNGPSTSEKNKQEINKMISSHFDTFYKNKQDAIKFILELPILEIQKFLDNLNACQNKQSIIYQITKKDLLIAKYDSKNSFCDIFKDKSDNLNLSNKKMVAFLLMRKEPQISAKHACLLSFIQNSITASESSQKINLFTTLFSECFKEIQSIKRCDESLHLMVHLFEDSFSIIQKCLSSCSVAKTLSIIPCISYVIQIYYSSAIRLFANSNIIKSLMKIIELVQKPELIQFQSYIKNAEFEGVSAIREKIYETSHPLERGKAQSFPTASFPQSSFLFLDFDKRCQSDQNHDIMTVQLIHEDCPVGNSIPCNDGIFSTYLKLTGKIQMKKPVLMLGNNVSVDFSSSGHAKDAQSFGRYGFKFGLRPVSTGKIIFEKSVQQQKIYKVFKSKEGFALYINTLRFLFVAVSSTLQSFFTVEQDNSSQQIKNLLRGKIIRQGLQQSSKVSQQYQNLEKIIVNFLSKQYDQPQKNIIKKINQRFLVEEKPTIETSKNQSKISKDLWNLDGIPQFIKPYIQEIKNFKGNFIDVFKEARVHAPPQGTYLHELKRPNFTPQLREAWLQGEALLFLTVLKHSGLLQFNLKFSFQYIKENLKAFQEARNGIFFAFISRMQIVRQWRDLVQTYHSKKQEVQAKKQPEAKEQEKPKQNKKQIQIKKNNRIIRTVQLTSKQTAKIESVPKKVSGSQKQQSKKSKEQIDQQKLKNIEKQIRQRLSDEYRIQQLCSLRKIEFTPNNIFDNATRIIEAVKNADITTPEYNQSVYIQPIQHLIKSCLFLLSCKSSNNNGFLEEDDSADCVSLGRSLSSDNKNIDNNKVEAFREWLENWKKWKGFKKQSKTQFKFPVLQIVQFVNNWVSVDEIKRFIVLRTKICQFRVDYYKNLNQLLKLTRQSILLSKYVFGPQILHLAGNFKQNLESSPQALLNQLIHHYNDYANTIKDIEARFIKDQLPTKFNQFVNATKSIIGVAAGQSKDANDQQINQKDFIDKLRINAEIIYLIESQNPAMSLDIALYFINFKFLSNQNQEILFLASLITQRAFLVQHSLDQILIALRKQVGNNNLAAKRWRDLFFIERILFLLRKLESVVRKRHLSIQQKEKTAENLFYLLNLTDIPSISKIGMKIIKKLKGIDFSNLPTLFSSRYKSVKLTQTLKIVIKECFSIQNSCNQNNVDLLSKKVLTIFKNSDFRTNLVQQRLLQPIIEEQKKQKLQALVQNASFSAEQSYNIVLALHQQEDLIWLLRVTYYIEELKRQSGKQKNTDIKDYKEYLETKNQKQNKKNDQQPSNNLSKPSNTQPNKNPKSNPQKQTFTKERILAFIPEKILSIDSQLEDQLPIGWYMSYCNVFKQFDTEKSLTKIQKNSKSKGKNSQIAQSPNKKVWQSTNFLKLNKKFQEFNSKPLEEPKQTDSEEVKAQFVKAKNFIKRIKKHLQKVFQIIETLTSFGFIALAQNLSKQKALQLCYLISLGAQNKLKPIKSEWTKDQYKNRLVIEDNVSMQSKVKVLLFSNENYSAFKEMLSLTSSGSIAVDNSISNYIQLNKKQYVLEDRATCQPFEDFLTNPVNSKRNQKYQEFCKEFIESQIFKMKKRQQEVYLPDYPKLKYHISQGGIESGLKNVTLVSTSEHSQTLQWLPIQDVLTNVNRSQADQSQFSTDSAQELMEKATQLIKSKLNANDAIDTEQKIMDYLLVSFYLKKLTKMNLKLVKRQILKELAISLVNLGEGFKSFQTIEHYENQMQKLLLKFIDSKNHNLRIFEIFQAGDYQISPTIAEYVNKTLMNQANDEIKKEIKQDIKTHHFPKSSYLLKSQPPQIEQNKLLKYWQKNILPKIHQFVKTTLRPLEIDDFFQQMRMPLRKNDQMQAKKIAYVICDNKLPQGAVLPDSNHNWNSFNIEDIQVGQYALIKLPRNQLEAISPLLMTANQEYRLVKIVFIDIKAPSVLVRYRIDQYSIMGYAWVPVNCLVQVQKQILHLSKQDLYTEIQKSIKGMIYGYSKLCLTQMTSVSDLDQTKLIKETISDLFIHDPISGLFSKTSNQWSMRHALKSMMDRNQLQIIEYLQKQFCSLQSFQTDLFTDQVVKLNRFSNAKALIVSFQKSAKISLTSGIKFYKDPYLFNQILHIYTTKSQKTQFEPLIFNDPNVFCKYYTNKECLKPSQLNKYIPNPIPVTVFGVTDIWTVGCYLGEVISQMAEVQMKIAYLDILKRINKLYIKWILQKKVAVLCSQLSKLVAKITNRIIIIQEKLNVKTTPDSLGVDQQMIKDLLNWIKILLQQQQKTPLSLYSELLQNLSELFAVIMRKLLPLFKGQTLPLHIQAMINLLNILIRINDHIKGQKITQKPQPVGQWERLLLIENIPDFVERKELVQKIKQIISDNKGKILTPKYDIFSKDDKICVCVQGWNITELVEEEIVEKIQKEVVEEEKQQQEDQGLLMEWQCFSCTFFNPMGNTHCEMCGTEMPPPPAAKQIYQKVESTDVGKAEKKLKQLQSKRFENIKEQIKKYFICYWQQYCKKAELSNKQLEQANKNKAFKKKQLQSKLEKIKPIPQKPAIQLKTGSDILGYAIIQSFLQHRWKAFKDNVKKLVENEESYLTKFKKLQILGYDLWCDNIYHQNPSFLSFQRLHQLMNYIQGQICKSSSSVLSYSQNSIRLLSKIPLLDEEDSPINYPVENNLGVKAKYKNLAELKSYNIRYSWKIVKELNVAASKCLQFINMNLKYHNEDTHENIDSDCLGAKIKSFRNLIMGTIKLQLTQKIIQKTSVLRQAEEVPKIYLERLRVREQRGKDSQVITTKQKDDFLFTKAHEQFSKISTAMLRPFKPKGTDPYLSFSITFRGQMAMGQAGPYRQFFTDISAQLDPKNNLGLFIPTPNNKHKSGQSKSKWTINPKANSSYHLNLFQFLGILMGCCIRTGTHLALDLPKMFWKLLVSEKITEKDLQQTDHRLIETLKMIKEIPSREMFEELEQYSEPITWISNTSDSEEHEIIHNGKNTKVIFQEKDKYIAEVKRKRIYEAVLQINRIKKGLQEMMPQAYFNSITGDELKLMICGRPKVDVDLLKKHTKYAGGLHEEERRIKYFWEVMREFEEHDKLKVIKFCWGQQRLPINSEEFERNNIRFMIKPMMNQKNSDQALPKADTCFFNIELPNYSTKEILKTKLLLAINMDCISINADDNFNPDDNPLMNEIEDDNTYNDQGGEEDWQ